MKLPRWVDRELAKLLIETIVVAIGLGIFGFALRFGWILAAKILG